MVKVCSSTSYPSENNEKYNNFFEKYDYPLHIFQKWAIEGIVEGNHVLVTAPTGSGKTMPGEFAIDFFHSKSKKTIYCSPIKALSNQKFYDFTRKYPNISIGLITGDIKCNANADVLIMTTEILLNKLYQLKSKQPMQVSTTSFEMDVENELGCVVFDEIHMINDESRGHVWENSILMLPKHVQMIGLSATLDDPEKFSRWLESRGDDAKTNQDKIVYLCSKKDRAVPLTHYTFITVPNGIFKVIKDKDLQQEIRSIINKPHVIQSDKGVFSDENYYKIDKMLKLFEDKNIRVKRHHAINVLAKHLFDNNMTPALCYVFSRKQLEICAREMNTEILEDDSKVRYIVQKECEQIIRKLPNFQEYLHLPEYVNLVNLLAKGVAIHHSGMMPILREMVELLFVKGYVKLLFCTETVAIGLNLPVKTTIFTDVNKHDGTSFRMLHGHEYTQAAGRAGRLGLDTVGHVIHLNNLFRNVNSVNYKQMLKGAPQKLTSKFKISYNLILNLIDTGDNNLSNFAKRSMISDELSNEMTDLDKKSALMRNECANLKTTMSLFKTPEECVEKYLDLLQSQKMSATKKRKEIERKITQMTQEYSTIENDKTTFLKYKQKRDDLERNEQEIEMLTTYTESKVNIILNLLKTEKFVENNSQPVTLTSQGQIASQLREVHCLVFANLFAKGAFNELTSSQMVALFSCFTNITVADELKKIAPTSEDKKIERLITDVCDAYDYYLQQEYELQINTGIDYAMHFDLINYVTQWCDCITVEDCKIFLQNLEYEKGIFLGEFIKALLKINNISNEMEKVAEMIGNIDLLSKLRAIPAMTLKYVATNQSLYI